jgi:hypothetical protein
VLLPAAGCAQREKKSEELPTLTFDTTDSLVAERTLDSLLAISFRPPKGWVRLPNASIDSAVKGLNPTLRAFVDQTPTIRTVFIDKSSGSYFVATKLDSFTLADTALIGQRAVEYYRAMDSTSVVRSAVFRWGPFLVQQVMVIGSQTVILKMIFSRSEIRRQPFEWDFQIPKTLYPDKARTVESVVGSLQIHNTIH